MRGLGLTGHRAGNMLAEAGAIVVAMSPILHCGWSVRAARIPCDKRLESLPYYRQNKAL